MSGGVNDGAIAVTDDTPCVLEFDHAEAIEIADALNDVAIHDTGAMRVVSGSHDKWGAVFVAFPPIGPCLLMLEKFRSRWIVAEMLTGGDV